jgi:hypothetical protein
MHAVPRTLIMPDDPCLDPAADNQKLLAQVVDYYHGALKRSAEAIDYLRKRGVKHGQAVEQFRIGYADRTLGLKLPSNQTTPGRAIRCRLQHLGLFRPSGHEHFTGCVTFPVFASDGSGRIVDLYGRKTLGTRLRKGTPLDMYLGEQRHGVWNGGALAAREEIILCSSIFDALTFWCCGYRNVTCTFGPDVVAEDHLAAFAEFKVRRVLLVTEPIAPRLLDAGVECYQLHLPHGASVESYAAKAADPAEALGALIRKAEWLGKGQAPPPTTVPVLPAALSSPTAIASTDAPEPDLPEDVASGDGDAPEELGGVVEETTPTGTSLSGSTNPGEATIVPATATALPERTASPLPPAPHPVDAEVRDDEVRLRFGDRQYRVRGWQKNHHFDQLRVNVLVSSAAGLFTDTFDLYSAKHRKAFVVQAAPELNVEERVVKNDLGRILLTLEEVHDQHVTEQLQPQATVPTMTDQEKQDALGLLRDPHLLDRIVADFALVGEPVNKLLGYLAAISRKLDEPLAVIIQSTSAAGKSALMDAVLAFVPPEDLVKYSAMTGQSLFYMGETDLQHKILAIVEEEGAQRASYALKLLQSERELTIASTGKEARTGRLVTQEYRVQGPVMMFLTTTRVQVDEELLNRCLVLAVNEERAQTQAIHQAQRHRQTLAGLLTGLERQHTLNLHRNAQRLLRPLLVANPFAEQLTFLDIQTRSRRDHQKYLTLIRATALLHQYQRPVQTVEHHGQRIEYIEVVPSDIEAANRLAHGVLGRSLDELPPQTRHLLELIDGMVTAACHAQGIDRTDYRFSRRAVREYTHWGHSQLAVHLRRLEELEYLLVHRGSRGRSFVYELTYQSPTGAAQRFVAGLLDVDQLRRHLPGSNGDRPGGVRPPSGAIPGHFRPAHSSATFGSANGCL